jgi:hypothetical protein
MLCVGHCMRRRPTPRTSRRRRWSSRPMTAPLPTMPSQQPPPLCDRKARRVQRIRCRRWSSRRSGQLASSASSRCHGRSHRRRCHRRSWRQTLRDRGHSQRSQRPPRQTPRQTRPAHSPRRRLVERSATGIGRGRQRDRRAGAAKRRIVFCTTARGSSAQLQCGLEPCWLPLDWPMGRWADGPKLSLTPVRMG